MKTTSLNIPFVAIVFLAIALLTGCNEAELHSQWPTKAISMDGADVVWPEDGQYFDEESKMLVVIMNDENNLYIWWLTRSQRTQMFVLQAGFTVWIDNSGGTDKVFGVQFPLGKVKRNGRNNPDYKPRTGIKDILEDSLYSLAIYSGSEENRQTMPKSKAEGLGIYPQLALDRGYLVYELKVPLNIAKDIKTIGVGFETGKLERPSAETSGGSGRGQGGGKGGGGKKIGGGNGSHGGEKSKVLEMWAKVHLAEKPVTEKAPRQFQ